MTQRLTEIQRGIDSYIHNKEWEYKEKKRKEKWGREGEVPEANRRVLAAAEEERLVSIDTERPN